MKQRQITFIAARVYHRSSNCFRNQSFYVLVAGVVILLPLNEIHAQPCFQKMIESKTRTLVKYNFNDRIKVITLDQNDSNDLNHHHYLSTFWQHRSQIFSFNMGAFSLYFLLKTLGKGLFMCSREHLIVSHYFFHSESLFSLFFLDRSLTNN